MQGKSQLKNSGKKYATIYQINIMKSIEERAKREGIISQHRADYPYDKKSVEFGYIQGAYDQKEVDIDKACDWLKERVQCGVHPQSAYGFAEEFRKAMEE